MTLRLVASIEIRNKALPPGLLPGTLVARSDFLDASDGDHVHVLDRAIASTKLKGVVVHQLNLLDLNLQLVVGPLQVLNVNVLLPHDARLLRHLLARVC